VNPQVLFALASMIYHDGWKRFLYITFFIIILACCSKDPKIKLENEMVSQKQLLESFDLLVPWTTPDDFKPKDWEVYVRVARMVQGSAPGAVKSALADFMNKAVNEEYKGYESESKLFLLMRIVFDLPERAPAKARFSFKGWENWPEPDEKGYVNLAWPISWKDNLPKLEASYKGSMGQPYGAVEEYQYLLDHFPYRSLTRK
jgi:hypothetical protein